MFSMGTPREPNLSSTPVTEARIAKRMTQADLGKVAGISTRWLSIIERGYVPLTHVRKRIAVALGQEESSLWPQLYEGIPEPADPAAPRHALHKRLHDLGEATRR